MPGLAGGTGVALLEPGMTLDEAIPLLSPLFWLKGNDVGGTTVTDYSGNARHGTASGSVTLTAGGILVAATGRVAIADFADASLQTALPTFRSVWGIFKKTAGSYLMTKGGSGANNYEWQLTCGHSAGSRPGGNIFNSSGGSLSQVTMPSGTGFVTGGWNAIGLSMFSTIVDTPQLPSINGESVAGVPSHTVTSGYANGPSQVQIFSRQDQASADYVGEGVHLIEVPYYLSPLDYRMLALAANASGFPVPIP